MTVEQAIHTLMSQSWGRLLAYLAKRTRDLTAAEDALADAFGRALEAWRLDGLPAAPEAWLLTAARNALTDAARRSRIRLAAAEEIASRREHLAVPAAPEVIPDERLALLFACAHPAIDASVRAPLLLQAVLGLDAATIAAAFVVSPAAMSQRLVRAKTKIRDAGIRFDAPEAHQLDERLPPVLDAIYLAFAAAWLDAHGDAQPRSGLALEAIRLGRVLVELLPDQPEALGLLALMLYCDARRAARGDADGRYVPIAEQAVGLWDAAQIAEAERLLWAASRLRKLGRFQLEAAIQSAHVQRRVTGSTNWAAITHLYDGLVQLSPTIGARVGRAAALAELAGAGTGLAELDLLDPALIRTYQPYWALRGHLLRLQGEDNLAKAAYRQAIELSESKAVRAFLLERCSSQ